MATGPRTIGILLFDDVEELDAVGPWEVLAAWTGSFPGDGWRVTTLSRTGGTVCAAKGLRMVAAERARTSPPPDIFIHPGGHGTRPLLENHDHLGWLRDIADRADLMTSVCTGSLVYAAAGLLRDRPATTHWASLDLLAQLDPTIDVRSEARWVDDGDVVTSAGVSAGIDMALHLVGRLASPARSAEVRRLIQYDPAPPH